ncbi:peroxide stress protein YaaA [Denitromonas ohlonensis]|uniref:UPF0246 protein FHP89_09530 n=2 Tax=Denitromonas TaxID=139331 RepID=A0A557SJJ4_9RHOO|nr:peroxide stress protein YaaA [Denitromonas ohlonensis]TVO69430.1 peroxide stress protein YaaA [Denitromonas ohlonensis]TVO77530.1 peroxide stress protein YaaA [Denitromonas ohlonensis]
MYFVISPAKSLDYETPAPSIKPTQPAFLDAAESLVGVMRDVTPAALGELMRISDKLAALNVARFAEWSRPFNAKNAKPCVFAFNGDVYDGLDAASLDAEGVAYAQQHLRILSGLYGVLRPLDLMQAYRLEMGTRLKTPAGKNLYEFWGDRPTEAINALLKKSSDAVLINLASEEYFKVIRPAALKGRLVTPVFEDWKGGRYKIISFHAKRARGQMVRYAIDHRLSEVDGLKQFDTDGYAFDAAASDADRWVFRRRQDGVR